MAEDYYYGQDQDKNENQSLNIQDFLYLCAAKWYWFLISFILMLGLACLYILCSQPVYTRQASILSASSPAWASARATPISTTR